MIADGEPVAAWIADFILYAVLIGAGATLVVDAWALAQTRILRWQTLDYAFVGRWLGHIPHGRIAHANIRAASPVSGEAAIGWIAHYAIGIAYAAILLAVFGLEWAQRPTLAPALIVGLGTIVAPFFVMQPCMGAGIAGSRTPNPAQTRLRGLLTHTVFGIGLYLSALLVGVLR
jgi:hypothetical protein